MSLPFLLTKQKNSKRIIEYASCVIIELSERVDSAPTHNTLSVEQLLANKRIAVLKHTPYSPNLTPCDFFLFP